MVSLRSGRSVYTRGMASRHYQGVVKNRLATLGARAARRWAMGVGTRSLGYASAAYLGVGLARGVSWKMRNAARNRKLLSRRVYRGTRETRKSIQEIARFTNQTTGNLINHVFHPFADFTSAPEFKAIRPDSTDSWAVDFDITRQLFSDTTSTGESKAPEIQANQNCKVDVAGIYMTIELVNDDPDTDLYVRTLLYRRRPGGSNGTTNTDILNDEFFQDPYDPCKKWDFNSKMNHLKYNDMAKIKLKLNKNRHAVYHDRTILLGRAADTGGLNKIVQKQFDGNRRCLKIKWFPKGGFRFTLNQDGDNFKTWFEERIYFRMFAMRKKILAHHDSYTPQPINYKIRNVIYYKKVQ